MGIWYIFYFYRNFKGFFIMSEILEDLIDIGYMKKGTFGTTMDIYGKDEQRVLYDRESKKIILSYKEK